MRPSSILPILFALAALSHAAKERVSILDFTTSPTARKAVDADASKYLTQQVRDAATSLLDAGRFDIMTRENILVMLPPGKKDLTECEGQCEIETARNIGSRWHVVGDVKKVGTRLVLSIRLYDVGSGTQLSGVSVKETTVDALGDKVESAAKELLTKIPGVAASEPPTARSEPAPSPTPSTPVPAAGRAAAKGGMVRIPAGCFQMGSPEGVGDDDEHPRHLVCVSAFSMDVTEVTQSEYQSVAGNNPSSGEDCGGDCPVEQVSWQDASDYCRRAGKRLPTEAEWEYAARAGSTTRYYWGDDTASAGDYAWYGGNSNGQKHPVGQKRPNAWGLYDMAGNVWEWVNNWKGFFPLGEQRNPTGPSSGSSRVFRGGSWNSASDGLCSTFRGGGNPGNRDFDLGFRCAGP